MKYFTYLLIVMMTGCASMAPQNEDSESFDGTSAIIGSIIGLVVGYAITGGNNALDTNSMQSISDALVQSSQYQTTPRDNTLSTEDSLPSISNASALLQLAKDQATSNASLSTQSKFVPSQCNIPDYKTYEWGNCIDLGGQWSEDHNSELPHFSCSIIKPNGINVGYGCTAHSNCWQCATN